MHANIKTALTVSAAFALLGCQSTKPESVYLEARQKPEPPKPVVKEVKMPVATPQLRRMPGSKDKERGGKSKEEDAKPSQTIAEATKKAKQGPTPEGFIEAVQTYDFLPGRVYEVFASPGHLTTIELRPGEKLIAKAAGDTANWTVADSHAGAGGGGGGSGEAARTLLMVKPIKPGVETNLVATTDQRIYQIDLKSLPETYHSSVRWHYPRDVASQLAERYRDKADADEAVIDTAVALRQLDFDYEIHANGEKPAWMPRLVFTDGSKTYIAFPENLASMQAPPLFVLGRKGKTQLVNYRVKANYYIVDRVFKRAELRLGEDPQRVVRIVRE